ncbi:hypothetical protein [Achromobacter sp. DMS1]|uniref:hypothetical protein n=1 Tax=Achromobacter sp. DMS1 TaxID=1688405 RepID=UPI00069E0434|nr:hypothetical protein [Achromobacter sp. DMS1]
MSTDHSPPTSFSRPNEELPQIHEAEGAPTWLVRAEHFIVAITQVRPGAKLSRNDNRDEYMLLLPPGIEATVECGGEARKAEGHSLSIVPPGASSIIAHAAGAVVRIFTICEADLAAASSNAALYAPIEGKTGTDEDRPLHPIDRQFRNYSLGTLDAEGEQLIQPRIYRSTNLMVNVFWPFRWPRPTNEMRPHVHADFDQASVALRGRWTHHVRTPWGADMNRWQDDLHVALDSPSVIVIPAGLIHTSRNLDADAWLIDVFGPPRRDFAHAGIVLNGAEYPDDRPRDDARAHNVPAAWQKRPG